MRCEREIVEENFGKRKQVRNNKKNVGRKFWEKKKRRGKKI
jgi:hypothetical protein